MSPRVRDGRDAEFYDDDDGSDVFERSTGYSRPRTKVRPDYSKAKLGTVLGVDRGRFEVLLDAADAGAGGTPLTVRAMKARQLGRKGVIVGDRVRLTGDTSGNTGSLARIASVDERTTVLRRTADDDDPFERPIVANADQLLIVTALADPPPRPGMIDRMLVAAYDAHIAPILCLTKADLAPADELLAQYGPLNIPIAEVQPGGGLDAVRALLNAHITVFVGHSGVGKSTLINALIPDANRVTGEVNAVTGRGRHTSTSALALALPGSTGWVIDTPGVRSFGLSHVDVDSVLGAFPDLAEIATHCPRGCTHQSTSPDCAIQAALESGALDPARLASLRRILTALHG
ncbi:MAG: ribosome small subunit-dependent GTPase A [Propionibacteriaceae bacterium]|jgi:ribosome biogenesis GTPase|nr:ribosome small subunit-dependent GTPase A [Propionibacteriaceae bacterium]